MSKKIFIGFISPADTHGVALFTSEQICRDVQRVVRDNLTGRDLKTCVIYDDTADGGAGIAVLRAEAPIDAEEEDQRFFIEFLTEVCGTLQHLKPHFTEPLPDVFFDEGDMIV